MSNSPRISFGAPHEEAAAIIRSKPAIVRDLWDQLAAELRIRAFTITGIEAVRVIERVRDKIAQVPEGADWEETRRSIADDLEQSLGSRDAAERRAELLLRTHAYQATQAAAWRQWMADDTVTHFQYIATRDDRVRPSHLALHGIVLPKDDPFWEDHMPPWEWGCRCQARPLTRGMVERIRRADATLPPEDRRVLDGPALQRLRQGQLVRGGRAYDVTAPRHRMTTGAPYWFRPDLLLLEYSELRRMMDPADLVRWEQWARSVTMPGGGTLLNAIARPRSLDPASLPDIPPETRALLRAIESYLGSGMRDHVRSAIEDLPARTAQLTAQTLLYYAPPGRSAAYYFGSKTIHVARTPTAWSGHRNTILHQWGHALADQSGLIKFSGGRATIDPRLQAAIQADTARLQWSSTQDLDAWLRRQYPGSDIDAIKRRAAFADTVGALTKGRIGYGHRPSYYARPGFADHEVIANAFSAALDGDPVFYRAFQHVVQLVQEIAGI